MCIRDRALQNVTFSVQKGEYVAIMGESGSGKTTLLNILACLDQPTEGEILLEGKDTLTIPERDISAFRRENLGFVFQDFNLLDTFSIRDNIFLPLVLSGKPYKEMNRRLIPIAGRLRIQDILGLSLIHISAPEDAVKNHGILSYIRRKNAQYIFMR